MIELTGKLQLNVNVSKQDEIDQAIKLLESLILSPSSHDQALQDFESSSPISNKAEESLALNKAAESLAGDSLAGDELDQKYSHNDYRLESIPDHNRKSGTSHVMEKLPPKILENKLKQFKTLFYDYVPVNEDISIYRISKPMIKSGLVKNNIEARELLRIALKHDLIKETRSEVYGR